MVGDTPVSYTHLDVYKRQVERGAHRGRGETANDGCALAEHRIEKTQQLLGDPIPGDDGRFNDERPDADGVGALSLIHI